MARFNIAEAKARFSAVVKKAMAGEEVVIAKDNKPILRLVRIEKAPKKRKPGSAKGEILHMASDFNAPLKEFAEYLK